MTRVRTIVAVGSVAIAFALPLGPVHAQMAVGGGGSPSTSNQSGGYGRGYGASPARGYGSSVMGGGFDPVMMMMMMGGDDLRMMRGRAGHLAPGLVDYIAGQTPNARFVAERAQTKRFDANPTPLPSFDFATPDGTSLTIKKFHGRVVLLNFWATWCAPCRKEIPALDRLEAQLGGRAFVIVPLSIDRGDAATASILVKQFYAMTHVTHLGIYLQPDEAVRRRLGIVAVPTTLLIDRNGESIGRLVGAAVWDSPRMISMLRAVIAETRPTRQDR